MGYLKRCCVLKCKSIRFEGGGGTLTSFHEFPSDLETRQNWMDLIPKENRKGQAEIKRASYVCGFHFKESDYHPTLHVPRLLRHTVPSLFLDNNTNEENSGQGVFVPIQKLICTNISVSGSQNGKENGVQKVKEFEEKSPLHEKNRVAHVIVNNINDSGSQNNEENVQKSEEKCSSLHISHIQIVDARTTFKYFPQTQPHDSFEVKKQPISFCYSKKQPKVGLHQDDTYIQGNVLTKKTELSTSLNASEINTQLIGPTCSKKQPEAHQEEQFYNPDIDLVTQTRSGLSSSHNLSAHHKQPVILTYSKEQPETPMEPRYEVPNFLPNRQQPVPGTSQKPEKLNKPSRRSCLKRQSEISVQASQEEQFANPAIVLQQPSTSFNSTEVCNSNKQPEIILESHQDVLINKPVDASRVSLDHCIPVYLITPPSSVVQNYFPRYGSTQQFENSPPIESSNSENIEQNHESTDVNIDEQQKSEMNSLRDHVEKLQKRIKGLNKVASRRNRRLRVLQQQLDSVGVQNKSYRTIKYLEHYQKVLRKAESGDFSATFLLEQISVYKDTPNSKSWCRWSQNTLNKCRDWRAISSKAYDFARNSKLLNLPHKTTLRRNNSFE